MLDARCSNESFEKRKKERKKEKQKKKELGMFSFYTTRSNGWARIATYGKVFYEQRTKCIRLLSRTVEAKNSVFRVLL